MRTYVLAAIGAAFAVAVLAAPAAARYDNHFSVIEKRVSGNQTNGGFHFHGRLFATFNPKDQVGNDRVRCRPNRGNRKLKCRAVVHLNGEVGGDGTLYVNGNLGRHDNRLNVVGGSGDFGTAAGKVKVGRRTLHFDLIS